MCLSPSLASWLPPRGLFPFFCLIVPGWFWWKRNVLGPGGVEDDLACWCCAGVAGRLILWIGVRMDGPGPWRWSSLIKISGLSADCCWDDLPREVMLWWGWVLYVDLDVWWGW